MDTCSIGLMVMSQQIVCTLAIQYMSHPLWVNCCVGSVEHETVVILPFPFFSVSEFSLMLKVSYLHQKQIQCWDMIPAWTRHRHQV